MTWFYYSLICAFAEALKDITSKKGLKDLDPLTVSWAYFVITTIILLPLLFFIEQPEIKNGFFLCLVAHGLTFGLSVYLYMKAISLTQLSLAIPLIMFTPIFMLVTSPIILGESPSRLGYFGTVLIVVGSYLLNIKKDSDGFLDPFKAIFTNRGSRIMLLVALLWSVTSTLDKLGVQKSSPIFWGICLYLFISFYMTLVVIFRKKLSYKKLTSNAKYLIPIGIFNGVQILTYVYALNTGLAVYVLSIKRTSVLMVILLSVVVFKEKNIKERLIASSIMLAGVIVIAFSK